MKKISHRALEISAGIMWSTVAIITFLKLPAAYIFLAKYAGILLILNSILLLLLSLSDSPSIRINKWRRAEAFFDLGFSLILLLDPVFSLLALPYLIGPWAVAKGLIRTTGGLSTSRKNPHWKGDFLAGIFLILLPLLVGHNPIDQPDGTRLLTAVLCAVLGGMNLYDFVRDRPEHSHSPHSQRSYYSNHRQTTFVENK